VIASLPPPVIASLQNLVNANGGAYFYKQKSSNFYDRMAHKFAQDAFFNECQQKNVWFCLASKGREACKVSRVTAKALLSMIGWTEWKFR
jgi:hypothetical protein